MLKTLHDLFDHIIAYFTAFMALAISLPLMKIGGAILLVARLVVDIPPAYARIKEWTSQSR